ncbi:myb-like protein X [Aethina tumida]|uniref:myb-like protein X n=1 Tax=Aethina tumida TaxID=116153 RepID=UPI0021485211|nr:myb-like protein X [Aethina tumida]
MGEMTENILDQTSLVTESTEEIEVFNEDTLQYSEETENIFNFTNLEESTFAKIEDKTKQLDYDSFLNDEMVTETVTSSNVKPVMDESIDYITSHNENTKEKHLTYSYEEEISSKYSQLKMTQATSELFQEETSKQINTHLNDQLHQKMSPITPIQVSVLPMKNNFMTGLSQNISTNLYTLESMGVTLTQQESTTTNIESSLSNFKIITINPVEINTISNKQEHHETVNENEIQSINVPNEEEEYVNSEISTSEAVKETGTSVTEFTHHLSEIETQAIHTSVKQKELEIENVTKIASRESLEPGEFQTTAYNRGENKIFNNQEIHSPKSTEISRPFEYSSSKVFPLNTTTKENYKYEKYQTTESKSEGTENETVKSVANESENYLKTIITQYHKSSEYSGTEEFRTIESNTEVGTYTEWQKNGITEFSMTKEHTGGKELASPQIGLSEKNYEQQPQSFEHSEQPTVKEHNQIHVENEEIYTSENYKKVQENMSVKEYYPLNTKEYQKTATEAETFTKEEKIKTEIHHPEEYQSKNEEYSASFEYSKPIKFIATGKILEEITEGKIIHNNPSVTWYGKSIPAVVQEISESTERRFEEYVLKKKFKQNNHTIVNITNQYYQHGENQTVKGNLQIKENNKYPETSVIEVSTMTGESKNFQTSKYTIFDKNYINYGETSEHYTGTTETQYSTIKNLQSHPEYQKGSTQLGENGITEGEVNLETLKENENFSPRYTEINIENEEYETTKRNIEIEENLEHQLTTMAEIHLPEVNIFSKKTHGVEEHSETFGLSEHSTHIIKGNMEISELSTTEENNVIQEYQSSENILESSGHKFYEHFQKGEHKFVGSTIETTATTENIESRTTENFITDHNENEEQVFETKNKNEGENYTEPFIYSYPTMEGLMTVVNNENLYSHSEHEKSTSLHHTKESFEIKEFQTSEQNTENEEHVSEEENLTPENEGASETYKEFEYSTAESAENGQYEISAQGSQTGEIDHEEEQSESSEENEQEFRTSEQSTEIEENIAGGEYLTPESASETSKELEYSTAKSNENGQNEISAQTSEIDNEEEQSESSEENEQEFRTSEQSTEVEENIPVEENLIPESELASETSKELEYSTAKSNENGQNEISAQESQTSEIDNEEEQSESSEENEQEFRTSEQRTEVEENIPEEENLSPETEVASETVKEFEYSIPESNENGQYENTAQESQSSEKGHNEEQSESFEKNEQKFQTSEQNMEAEENISVEENLTPAGEIASETVKEFENSIGKSNENGQEPREKGLNEEQSESFDESEQEFQTSEQNTEAEENMSVEENLTSESEVASETLKKSEHSIAEASKNGQYETTEEESQNSEEATYEEQSESLEESEKEFQTSEQNTESVENMSVKENLTPESEVSPKNFEEIEYSTKERNEKGQYETEQELQSSERGQNAEKSENFVENEQVTTERSETKENIQNEIEEYTPVKESSEMPTEYSQEEISEYIESQETNLVEIPTTEENKENDEYMSETNYLFSKEGNHQLMTEELHTTKSITEIEENVSQEEYSTPENVYLYSNQKKTYISNQPQTEYNQNTENYEYHTMEHHFYTEQQKSESENPLTSMTVTEENYENERFQSTEHKMLTFGTQGEEIHENFHPSEQSILSLYSEKKEKTEGEVLQSSEISEIEENFELTFAIATTEENNGTEEYYHPENTTLYKKYGKYGEKVSESFEPSDHTIFHLYSKGHYKIEEIVTSSESSEIEENFEHLMSSAMDLTEGHIETEEYYNPENTTLYKKYGKHGEKVSKSFEPMKVVKLKKILNI